MATIYQCSNRSLGLTSRCAPANLGKRAKCAGCGSSIIALTGHAVLIPHSGGTNEYRLADAVREYATMAAAERAASKAYEADNRSDLVARFII